nr:MAG TPA: hypothetical protein [Caudoviricetes sp.]
MQQLSLYGVGHFGTLVLPVEQTIHVALRQKY